MKRERRQQVQGRAQPGYPAAQAGLHREPLRRAKAERQQEPAASRIREVARLMAKYNPPDHNELAVGPISGEAETCIQPREVENVTRKYQEVPKE